MKKVTNAEREANLKRVAPLIQYLKENHISQSEVAQRSGLALGTVNRILHGWQVLMPNTLQRIADALEVEYYILNGEDTVQRAFNLEEVCGFLEYKGVITKVSSVYDVKCWLKSIEGEVSEPDDEQVVIKSK
ncbi:MAG: helix-turn-helix transcriptional regulator [Bacteroidales bacterium]|nr:helix-turn-helix transcriptional regulator [Bacteroidales bacterium]MBO5075934.1 helix-turn-helix transcriptional regulator [Bacteroidales bacterium]